MECGLGCIDICGSICIMVKYFCFVLSCSMLSFPSIIDTLHGPCKPMYGVKPSFELNEAHPYKLYKFNMFGLPKPEIALGDNKYGLEQTAHTLLECLRHGHKVYVLQEKIIPAEQADQAPKNQEEIDRHMAWKNDLIAMLQAKAPHDISVEITKDVVRLYGTKSSTTKKESYNEIIQHKRKK